MNSFKNNPMVLHVRVVSGTGGGPEKTILNSPRFLPDRGYQAVCAYMHPPGDPGFDELRRRAEDLGARLVGIEDRGPWDLRVAWRLLRLCRRHRAAIWHGHDYKSNALGLLLGRFWPMRLVTTLHGWTVLSGRTPLYYKLDRLCLRHYERLVCVSADLREACIRNGVRPERCALIENAIDSARCRRQCAPDEAKRRVGLDPGRLLVGSVGRLSPEKGLAGLVRAVERLARVGANVELAAVGEGPQKAELETLAAGLGIADRVHLPGYQADTLAWYQAMDVFASNSVREGLPNVLLEAMAAEVPVVATRIAGVPALVEHEHSGLLIEPGDAEGLHAALARLLADADLRRRLGAAGRATVESRYSFAARMDKVCAVYDGLLHS